MVYNERSTPEIHTRPYTLSLHYTLPISVLSPELAYSNWGATFTVGTDFDLVTNDTIVVMDAFDAPVIDLGAEYALGFGAKAYGGVNYDVDGNAFSGAKVGVSFAF